MPSKKQRAKAAKAKAKKKTGNENNGVIESVKDRAVRHNKSLFDVAAKFSSNFVFGERYDGASCRHGATDPISHRCQRMVDGVTKIFEEGIIDPENLDSNSCGNIPVTSLMGRFCNHDKREELSLVSAGDFGYQEESCNIAYLSALGVELALQGHADIAYTTMAPYIMSMGKQPEGNKMHQFAIDMAHSTGKQTQEGIAFFAKRGSCDCLRKQFNLKAIRKEANASECSNCRQPGSKKKLLLCIRCKSAQYCSKDCQVQHWKAHKPDCDNCKKAGEAAARSANVDTFATEQVMHKFGEDGKVTTSYHREGSVAPDGGAYYTTKDGERIQMSESTAVIFSTLLSHPKGQTIIEKLRGNTKLGEAMMEYLADPNDTLMKYRNDSDIGEMVRDFGELMKASGAEQL